VSDGWSRSHPARGNVAEIDDEDQPLDGSRAQPTRVGRRRRERAATARRRRGRFVVVIGLVVALIVAGGVALVANKMFGGPEAAPDYDAGSAGPDVVIRVAPGETASEVSELMAEKGVVASSAAFYEAAVQDSGMDSLQPGYYAIPTKIPAEQAVETLVGPDSRVGQTVLSEGRQLHDSRDVSTSAIKEGIYTKIAKASCHGETDQPQCVTYDELNAAGASEDLNALCVPAWAVAGVRAVPDRDRQLEGLIASGAWDFDPTGTPTQILCQLVTESAQRYEQTGLLDPAKESGLSPYQLLVAASLVERESLPEDFTKVARVILNRLAVGQPLQFDSTVNYALDETEVATTDDDRARPTPWNTYAMAGLPATPIAAPSIDALKAVEEPEPGPWLFFVTVDKQGTTLFTNNYDEHLRNIDKARESGILDSGR
jgi:peptidoglycan lytic transglycosylase G